MLVHNSIQDIYGLAWATFTTTDKFIYDKNLDCIVLETSLCLGLLLGQKFGSLENLNWFLMYPVILNAWQRLPVHPLNGFNKNIGEFNFAP